MRDNDKIAELMEKFLDEEHSIHAVLIAKLDEVRVLILGNQARLQNLATSGDASGSSRVVQLLEKLTEVSESLVRKEDDQNIQSDRILSRIDAAANDLHARIKKEADWLSTHALVPHDEKQYLQMLSLKLAIWFVFVMPIIFVFLSFLDHYLDELRFGHQGAWSVNADILMVSGIGLTVLLVLSYRRKRQTK